MLVDLHLLGTTLKLHKGERVELFPTTNLPPSAGYKYFARGEGPYWDDSSMAIAETEVQIVN